MFNIIEIKCDLLMIKALFLEHLPYADKEEQLSKNVLLNPTRTLWAGLLSGSTMSSFLNLYLHIMRFHAVKKKLLTQGSVFK